jgi:hypothetical protein
MTGQIAEYSQVSGKMATSKVLRKTHIAKLDTRLALIHYTRGYHCAGSMARLDAEKWSVQYMFDGALRGQAFNNVADAGARFDFLSKALRGAK